CHGYAALDHQLPEGPSNYALEVLRSLAHCRCYHPSAGSLRTPSARFVLNSATSPVGVPVFMPSFTTELDVARPRYLGDNTWFLPSQRQINAVFGRNGSGKSLLLRQTRSKDNRTNHYVVRERRGELASKPGIRDSVARRNEGGSSNFAVNYRQQAVTRLQ